MDKYGVTITFTERVLGTVPKDEEVYRSYIASKAEELSDEQLEQELETVPEDIEEKGWTGFHHNADGPVLYDYHVKGFFKDACSMLRRASGTESKKVRAYKKIIDGLVFIEPRQIPLDTGNQELGVLERPLRASTAQGERVSLARSDTCPPGTQMSFTVNVLGQVSEKLLREWLDYGSLRGFGQWRNAGWGRFEYEIEKLS